MEHRNVMIVAGEASGDLHGSNLVNAIRRKKENIRFFGVGGDKMKAAGVELIADIKTLSVMGGTEVLGRFPSVLRTLLKVRGQIRAVRPDLLILIDFPEFNLKAAGYAKTLGVPVLYYISPKVWAWRSGRVKTIKKRVDRIAVILPFEQDFYRKHGIDAVYVGNPLLDTGLTADCRSEKNKSERGKTIGLLPGSRETEVTGLLPVMLEAARRLTSKDPELGFVISKAPGMNPSIVEAILADFGKDIRVHTETADVREVFNQCDWVMAASGTVTLEAAICRVPMIVLYKMSPLSFFLAKRLVKLPHVSLVNLIAGCEVVPELLQKRATPENLVAVAEQRILNPAGRDRMISGLKRVGQLLGQPGASDRTARIALEMLA